MTEHAKMRHMLRAYLAIAAAQGVSLHDILSGPPIAFQQPNPEVEAAAEAKRQRRIERNKRLSK